VLTLYGLNAAGLQGAGDYGDWPVDAHHILAIQVDGTQSGQQGILMLESVQTN
jgi:hypothetical protein